MVDQSFQMKVLTFLKVLPALEFKVQLTHNATKSMVKTALIKAPLVPFNPWPVQQIQTSLNGIK